MEKAVQLLNITPESSHYGSWHNHSYYLLSSVKWALLSPTRRRGNQGSENVGDLFTSRKKLGPVITLFHLLRACLQSSRSAVPLPSLSSLRSYHVLGMFLLYSYDFLPQRELNECGSGLLSEEVGWLLWLVSLGRITRISSSLPSFIGSDLFFFRARAVLGS